MERVISELKKESFSGADILRILEGKCTILHYPMLEHVNSIDELFTTNNSVCILYKTAPDYGHWVALLRHRNSIEFFDSLGYFPDEEFDFISEDMQCPRYLSQLLVDCPLDIEYNDKKLQSKTASTCARHCVYRICMKNLPLKRYQSMISNFRDMTPDELVTMMTSMM
jgi:hypothetical protein